MKKTLSIGASSSFPPVRAGLFGWWDAQSFSGSTWFDKSGNNRNATSSGAITKVSQSGINSLGTIDCLQGGTSSSITFPSGVLPATYTLFHVTRYTGGTRTRIVASSDGVNWLSGFWGGLSGVAFHNGWLTQSSYDHYYNNWVVSTDQNALYRANRVQTSTSSGGSASCRLGINTFGGETSDWQVAEVIVYDRTLSQSEYESVETYLTNKYRLEPEGLSVPTRGLMCYLDAGLTDSFTPGSNSTSSLLWRDLTNYKRNFTWGSSAWTKSGDLSFIPTSGRMASGPASNSLGLVANDGYTIIYIAATNNFGTNGAFKVFGDTGISRGIFVHPTWVGSPPILYWDQGGCCDGSQRLNVDISGQTGMRMWVLRRQLNGNRQIFRGNVQVASTTTAPASPPYNATAMQINPNDEGYNWDANLAAFMIYNHGITDQEISNIYTYFNSRGLVNS